MRWSPIVPVMTQSNNMSQKEAQLDRNNSNITQTLDASVGVTSLHLNCSPPTPGSCTDSRGRTWHTGQQSDDRLLSSVGEAKPIGSYWSAVITASSATAVWDMEPTGVHACSPNTHIGPQSFWVSTVRGHPWWPEVATSRENEAWPETYSL